MVRGAKNPIQTLVILGAGGDLSSRLLLPGLASLLASSRGVRLRLIGVGSDPMSAEQWRRRVSTAFAGTSSALASEVAESATWLQADVTDAADLRRILDAASGRTALYFALPPAVAEAACRKLSALELPEGIVLALEKPFGTDLRSARRLNRLLQTMLPEEQVFRVDHFLGKSTVLDLIGLRFANRLFEPLLAAPHVERIDIVFDERLALEGRADYYDKAGALIDMVQSHLLQVLALATMEPPSSVSSEDLRGAMAQVLRATRPWKADGTASRRARYTAGTVGDRRLPAYATEKGVDRTRGTETLAEMTVAIDTWRWAGVPITLRSGKAIEGARQEIVFTIRDVPHLPIGFDGPSRRAQLRIGMNPGGLAIDVVTNGGGDPFDLEWNTLRADFAPGELTAYGEVLAELVEGDPTLSVRGDIAEQCWRIVTPVINAWRRDAVPLDSYAAGSEGPRRWRAPIVAEAELPR